MSHDTAFRNPAFGVTKRTGFAASDQSLDLLSHMSICRKSVSRSLCILKIITKYTHMEKADLGQRCLLHHKAGFPDDVTYVHLFCIVRL